MALLHCRTSVAWAALPTPRRCASHKVPSAPPTPPPPRTSCRSHFRRSLLSRGPRLPRRREHARHLQLDKRGGRRAVSLQLLSHVFFNGCQLLGGLARQQSRCAAGAIAEGHERFRGLRESPVLSHLFGRGLLETCPVQATGSLGGLREAKEGRPLRQRYVGVTVLLHRAKNQSEGLCLRRRGPDGETEEAAGLEEPKGLREEKL